MLQLFDGGAYRFLRAAAFFEAGSDVEVNLLSKYAHIVTARSINDHIRIRTSKTSGQQEIGIILTVQRIAAPVWSM